MSLGFEELMRAWDGEGVVTHYDRPTGTWIFIAIHSSALGQPSGGTRMKVYDQPWDGLKDALRLAEGMTHKWASLYLEGVPGTGGAKAVLALAHPVDGEERRALMHRYGRLVESLQGAFATGEDLGTTPQDMAWIDEETRWVHGVDREAGLEGPLSDPGPFTARGVFVGIRAAVTHTFGSADLTGKRVAVEGVGDVGAPLARLLAEAGAELVLQDLDRPRAEALARELGGELLSEGVDPRQAPCDVYAPCAVGATVNRDSIPTLACRIVAGSANNQLAEPEDAEALHRRGILYAPDYVINGGGALAFGLIAAGETDVETLFRRVEGLEATLGEIFREAEAGGTSPLAASHRRVERALEDARRRAAAAPAGG